MSRPTPLVWKSEFLVGIEPIDRQHKVIFDSLLAIENSLDKRDPWHIVEWFITELEKSIVSHFLAEETLLELFQYPQIELHRAQHSKLKAGIKELEQTLKQSMSTTALVPYFEQWFIKHVLAEDRGYVAHLKPRMPAP